MHGQRNSVVSAGAKPCTVQPELSLENKSRCLPWMSPVPFTTTTDLFEVCCCPFSVGGNRGCRLCSTCLARVSKILPTSYSKYFVVLACTVRAKCSVLLMSMWPWSHVSVCKQPHSHVLVPCPWVSQVTSQHYARSHSWDCSKTY